MAKEAQSYDIPANQEAFITDSEPLPVIPFNPAGFQYISVESPDKPADEPPKAVARAPAPSFKNCAEEVPASFVEKAANPGWAHNAAIITETNNFFIQPPAHLSIIILFRLFLHCYFQPCRKHV
jgi:hypothetical protein